MTPTGTFTTLVSFDGTNGAHPVAGQSGTTTFADTNGIGPGPFFYRVGVQYP